MLMQVIFHASIEEDAGHFDLDDVADAACKKLIFRHPALFGQEGGQSWTSSSAGRRATPPTLSPWRRWPGLCPPCGGPGKSRSGPGRL